MTTPQPGQTPAQQILRGLAAEGFTDSEIAEGSGVHRVTICRIRNGQLSGDRSLPALRDLVQAMQAEGMQPPRLDLATPSNSARDPRGSRAGTGTGASSHMRRRETPAGAADDSAEAEEEEVAAPLGWQGWATIGGVVLGGVALVWYALTHPGPIV